MKCLVLKSLHGGNRLIKSPDGKYYLDTDAALVRVSKREVLSYLGGESDR